MTIGQRLGEFHEKNPCAILDCIAGRLISKAPCTVNLASVDDEIQRSCEIIQADRVAMCTVLLKGVEVNRRVLKLIESRFRNVRLCVFVAR